MRLYVVLLFLLLTSFTASAQTLEELDTMSTMELIDTLFIDRDLNNWSFRLYTNLKEQRMRVSNGISNVSIVPNNPFGVGFGVATKKLVIDIGFNLKTNEVHTDRFDMQGSFMHQNHMVGFFLQHYKGFNVRNKESDYSYFREDIKLQSSGIRYLYMFNANEHSLSSLKTGLARQKRSSYSFGAGGFILQTNQKADSSFIDSTLEPSFNDQALIVKTSGFGVGGSLGFSSLIVLPADFFIGLSCNAGLGLSFDKVHTETETYVPGNPLIYQIGLMANIGYNGEGIYLNLSIDENLYGTDLDFGNKGVYNQINAKLAIGFKYGRKKYLSLNNIK